jgi:hypothetical protein
MHLEKLKREHLLRVVRETATSDRPVAIRQGNVSSWAHATSKPFGSQFKPIRPNCAGPQLSISNPVRNLDNVRPFVRSEPAIHKPGDITLPYSKVYSPESPEIKEVLRIQREFWKNLGVPRGGDVRTKV